MATKTDEELALAFAKRSDLAALRELRVRCQPLVQSQVARYVAGPGHIPRIAIETKADELLVDAARSFNPAAGAAFKTHLFNYLRRLDRYTKANANIAYMPEARANLITQFTTQMKIVEDQKRRPATNEELADHMSLPVASVELMRKSLRREIPWSQVAGPQTNQLESARINQLMDDIYYELSPDERVVFEHITGRGRKKTSSGQELAKITGFSQAKVSVLRSRIAQRMRPYLGSQTQVIM